MSDSRSNAPASHLRPPAILVFLLMCSTLIAFAVHASAADLQSTTQPAISQPPPPEPTAPQTQPSTAPAADADKLHEVVVSADLDRSREQIAPSLGAVSYTIGAAQIQNIPGGDNAPFQQVLLRAPGVVQDSFGQVHVRGEHANLTYRVNGVLLPEGIASGIGGFGQEIDTRVVNSATLITGSLPAQFGFRTAGVVDVTTKTGASLDHNELSIYGGNYDTIQPGLLLGGTHGKLDYFVSGSFKHSSLGVENTTSSTEPIHDITNQAKGFAYIGYRLDDTSRLTFLLNASNSTFQIPNTPGVPPAFTLAGHPSANSLDTNEQQAEQDYYGVVSYQKILDKLTFQVSLFTRYGQVHFAPDPVNDLIFQGVAGRITNGFLTSGAQFDASYVLNDRHTIRFGFLGDYTQADVSNNTSVFPVDAAGNQSSTTPFSISDDRGNWGGEFGIYIQDEWKLAERLTLNYGGRFDVYHASFNDENQLSPRANLVWRMDDLTTAHIGYARYFVPPPIQYTWPSTINKFAGTTNQPENFGDTPPSAERSNYYDLGISRQVSPAWQVTIDGFYKDVRPCSTQGSSAAL